MKKRLIFSVIGAILSLILLLPFDRTLTTSVGFAVLIAGLVVLYATKKILKVHVLAAILSYFTVFIILAFYVLPSVAISHGQGTVLTDNWWQAMNWVKNNTDECAVIATYWDPGHFITGIARRAVIYDGASQNDVLTLNVSETNRLGINISQYSEGVNLERYDNGIVQVVSRSGGNITTARMKDVAISMLTSNESLALDLLKKYRKPNCSEMYFIASSDLIFKSQWWTYFATWDPTRDGDKPLSKGDIYTYAVAQLTRRKPLPQFGVVGYEYPLSQMQSIVLCQQNNTIAACSKDAIGLFQSGEQFARIKKIVWPTERGLMSMEDKSAELPGTILVLDQTAQIIAYLRPELEDALFTRMFFYNGAGLEKFELVGNWGGEVKLFRVKFD